MSWWYSPLYKIMWRFCTVNTLFLYGIHFIFVRYTLYFCTVYTLFLYGIHFIFVQYTLNFCTVYTYFCTVYTLFLYSIHFFLYIIHFIFVQYTLYFYGILWQVLKFFIIHPSTSEHAYHTDYFRTLFKIVSMVTQNTKPLKASTNIAPYPLS